MTWLLVDDDVDVLHVKIELEMTWIACIKRLEVGDMTWLLVEIDVDALRVEIGLEMTWIACIKRFEVSDMAWLLVEDDVDILHVEIEHVVGISFIRDIDKLITHAITLFSHT